MVNTPATSDQDGQNNKRAQYIRRYDAVSDKFRKTEAFQESAENAGQSPEILRIGGIMDNVRDSITHAAGFEKTNLELEFEELFAQAQNELDRLLHSEDAVKVILGKVSADELAAIDREIEEVDRILEIQEQRNLVTHRWDSTESGLTERFRSGALIAEVDFRSTKDGAVASHPNKIRKGAMKNKAYLVFGDSIAHSTTEELKMKYPDLLTLERAFEVLEEYGDKHKLVVDAKDEGVALDLIKFLGEGGRFEKLQSRVVVAAFSVKVIFELMDNLPGLAGYYLQGNPVARAKLEKDLSEKEFMDLREGGGWKKRTLGPVVFYKSEGVSVDGQVEDLPTEDSHPEIEGFDKATVKYAFTTIPRRIMDKCKGNPAAISLSTATVWATLKSLLYPKGKRQKVREEYLARRVQKLKEQGVDAMSVAWVSEKLKGDPAKEVDALYHAGVRVIYTKNAVSVARNLQIEKPSNFDNVMENMGTNFGLGVHLTHEMEKLFAGDIPKDQFVKKWAHIADFSKWTTNQIKMLYESLNIQRDPRLDDIFEKLSASRTENPRKFLDTVNALERRVYRYDTDSPAPFELTMRDAAKLLFMVDDELPPSYNETLARISNIKKQSLHAYFAVLDDARGFVNTNPEARTPEFAPLLPGMAERFPGFTSQNIAHLLKDLGEDTKGEEDPDLLRWAA